MTDKELFLKYNMVPTSGIPKDADLTNKLFNNEITWPASGINHKLLILLHASYTCNAKCIYCENGELRKKYCGRTITKENLKLLVEKLGKQIREVTWHGGEPLTLPEELLIYLEDLKKEYGCDFTTSLQTNGILLTEEKIKFLKDLGISFGTSFDGIHNDVSRGTASTNAMLRIIKDHPDLTGFICVHYRDTIDELIQNYEYFKSIGAKNIQSCVIREIVLQDDNPLLVPNDIAIDRVLKYIDYWIHDTANPIWDQFLIRQIDRLLGETTTCEDRNCIGGWIIIDPDGNIGVCGHAADDGTLGNIKDISTAEDFMYSPKYLSLMGKQLKLDKSCSGCTWYNVCHAACMGLNYEHDHSYKTVNPRNCEFQRGILNGIYELIKDIDTSRRDLYNPIFLQELEKNNYYSLTEIKEIENGKHSNS